MKTNERLSNWIEPALQGLSYWVGYKKQLFRHYPLSEGAIVSEALHLIYSNLDASQNLLCEVMYRRLSRDLSCMGNSRADILIKNDNKIESIIEVKRGSASSRIINSDFDRLYQAKENIPEARCYLLLVCQNRRPNEFVNENGVARRALIQRTGYQLRVRRVCKSSDTFKKIDNANYACLIEVEKSISEFAS